jgi:2-phosphoglycerate kinase
MTGRRPPDSTLIGTASEAGLEALKSLDVPLVVLVGGATGTGKSTVATEVAHRLGITRVTSTDVVRQTMRAFFSREFMPSIHYSSFEAAPAVRTDEVEADRVLLGFLEQTRNVLVGVKAVLGRALEEGYSLALEGVHLVPGLIPPVEGAVFCQVLLAIEDEEEHAAHFWTRDEEGLRPFDKYLRALSDIRHLQDYLVERAARAKVPVIENASVESTVEHVIDLVLAEVERVRAPA